VARVVTSPGSAPSPVAAAVAAADLVVAIAGPWSATIATRRVICRGSVPRGEVAAAAVVVVDEVATATTAVNRGICLVTAPPRDKAVAAVVAVETATTVNSQVIFLGIAPSRGRAVAAAAAFAVEIVTASNATVARDMATCRGNAPSDFQLDFHQAKQR